MSSSDTSSASKSSAMLRKEDTFIVTEKDIPSRASPCDDLRRKKAMALAKANARHALKMEPGQIYPHRHSKTHKTFTNQGGGRSSQRYNRAYIESTGSELKNCRGENIYFHWKESNGSSTKHASRVLPSVRKLYEYKKQRLKSKSFESWKSAPNKKSISSKISSKRDTSLKRSKTVVTASSDHESTTVLSAATRLNIRVAFAVNDNTRLEHTDVITEYDLTRFDDCIGRNKRYPLSVIPETSKNTPRKDIIQTHSNNNLQHIESVSSKVVNSSDSISRADDTQNLEVLTRLSPSDLPLAVDIKDSSKIPREPTHRLHYEPILNIPVQYSTYASRDVHNVSGSDSFMQKHEKTKGPEIKSEIESRPETSNFTPEASYKSEDIINAFKTNGYPVESARVLFPETRLNVHSSADRNGMEPVLFRHTRTEPVYRENKVSVTDNKIAGNASVRDNSITGHKYDRDNMITGHVCDRDNTVTDHVSEMDDKIHGYLSDNDNKMLGHLSDRDNKILGHASVRDNLITGRVNDRDNTITDNASGKDNKILGHLSDRDNTILGHISDTDNKITDHVSISDNLEPANDNISRGQESAINSQSPTDFPTDRNINTRSTREHTRNDSDGRQAHRTDNEIAETDAIAKSNINTELENVKSTEHILVSDGSINGSDVIKAKDCNSEGTSSRSNEIMNSFDLSGNSSDQSIQLSVSKGLKLTEMSAKQSKENKNKKINTTSPGDNSGKINKKEKEVSAQLKEVCVKSALKSKSSSQDRGSKMNVRNHTRTTVILPGGDHNHVVKADPTHPPVIVSRQRIDHRFVNKPSRKGKGLGTLQFERSLVEPGPQPCVTELKQGTTVVAGHALETSQHGAEVSMATSQVNTNITAGRQRRKPGLDKTDSLFLVAASANNRSPHNNETCQSGLNHIGLSETPSNAEKQHLASRDVHVSNTRPVQTARDISPITNTGDRVVTDKHCHNMNLACQSITDAPSNDTLNLALFYLKEGEETNSTTLSIDRFKDSSSLALGELHSSGGVEKPGIAATNGVSSRKSKTLRNPKNEVKNADFGSRQETKEKLQYTSQRNGNRLQIHVAVSANNMSRILSRRGHCYSCEEESMANHESISVGKIVYDEFHAVAISAAVVRESRSHSGDGDHHISAAAITCGNQTRSDAHPGDSIATKTLQKSVYSGTTDNTSQSKDNVLAVTADFRSSVIGKTQFNGHAGRNANCVDYTKPISTQTVDKSDDKGKDLLHNRKITSKAKERKRLTLSLHTQKMEFRELPKKNVAKTSTTQQVHSKSTMRHDNTGSQTGSFITPQKSVALQDIQNDVKGIKCPVSNSEMMFQDPMRPKTAGLSAYATHHQRDDLWSVNTGDGYDDDGEEDEDDQIVFIDEEQDFYKVFGYNAETVAILNATKVYPVQDSVVAAVTTAEQSAYSSKKSQELYVGRCDSGTHNSVLNNSVREIITENNKTLTNKTISNGDIHVLRNETKSKQTDHNKALKYNSNSLIHTDNSFSKNIPDNYRPAATGNHGYVNIHRKQSKNHLESTTAAHVTEPHPVVNNQSSVEGVFTKDGRKIDYSSPNEQRSGMSQPARNNKELMMIKPREHELTELKKLATVPGSHKMPTFPISDLVCPEATTITETSPSDNHSLHGHQQKTRRRIHSDADIPTANNDIPASIPDFHSERNVAIQNEHLLHLRDAGIQGNKDSKSHVALRNHLATEKHINHTRYHRHINNGLISVHKNSSIQTSVVSDKMAPSRTKDHTEGRHGATKDAVKPQNLRSKENTSYLEHSSQNPYSNAADRILSRISDTENLICSRSEVYNNPPDKIHNRTAGPRDLNSPLRRMSHPVDTRLKNTQAGSYFVARPRKLKPILQLSEVNPDQK